MARRFKHGINCQTANAAKFHQLIPVLYQEVAPAESVEGKIQSRLFSDTTTKPILNRCYFDLYAYYVPYRLLWDNFTQFLSDPDVSLTVPVVGNLFPANFETRYALGADGVSAGTQNTAWLRYTYNMIWNKFFRESKGQATVSDTNNTLLTANVRPSTFHESVRDQTNVTTTPIPSGTIDDMREAFAEDRWQKMRAYYGDRWTDYLAAHGVEASWGILEEPEAIAQNHADCNFRVQTSANEITGVNLNVGDPAGYFDSVNTLNIPRRFFPEHGIFAVFCVAKIDSWQVNGHLHPNLAMDSKEKFYSPEYNADTDEEWYEQLWYGSSVATTQHYMPKFENYRKGSNCWGQQEGYGLYGYVAKCNWNTDVEESYRRRDPTDYDHFFTGTMFDASPSPHYQVTTKATLTKHSPIPKGRASVY